jgi:LysM repeat protein
MKTSHIITKKLLAEQAMHRDPAYQEFARLGQILRESAIPQKDIPGIFKAVADGAAAGGNVDKEGDAPASNRTLIGKGADVGSAISKAFDSVKKYIGNSGPIKGVDAAVDSAQEQIMAAAGGQSGKVGQALEWYRELMQVPGMGLAAKSIILGLAALSGAGLGAAAVVGGIAFADRMLQGDEFSSSIWSGIKGGATAAALGAANNAMAGTNSPVAADDGTTAGIQAQIDAPPGTSSAPDQFGKAGGEYSDAANNAYKQNPDPGDAPVDPNTRADYTQPDAGGGTYTIVKGDQLGFIAQANGTTVEAIRAANPDIDFSKALQPGQEINLPAAGTPGQGNVFRNYQGGMYGDKAVRESVIDQALTIRMWALNESRGRPGQRPIYITESGRRLIFKMIAKQYQLDEGALDKLKSFNKKASNFVVKVAAPIKKAAAAGWDSATNKITYQDLERGWRRSAKLAGEDSVDSEQVKTFLRSRGVKDPLINKVFAQLNIPTDAAAGGTALRPNVSTTAAATDAAGLDPRLGAALRSYAGAGSLTKQAPGAVPSASATATTPAVQTAPAAGATTPAPATKAPAAQNPAGFNATNVMKLPGMEKYAKAAPAGPAKTANFGAGPTGYGKTTTSFKQPGAKTAAAPVAPTGTKVVAGGPTSSEREKLAKRIQAAQVAESVDIAEVLWRKIKSKK